jgi:hypothetical protein
MASSAPAAAGGWGHGPSFKQAAKVIHQAAVDTSKGVKAVGKAVGSISVGGSGGDGSSGGKMAAGESSPGETVSRQLLGPPLKEVVEDSAAHAVPPGTPTVENASNRLPVSCGTSCPDPSTNPAWDGDTPDSLNPAWKAEPAPPTTAVPEATD